MRDLLATLLVFGSLPYCFRDPFIGLLVFTWLAYMRIQDLCWGFARELRFSYIVGLVMVLGFLMNEKERPFFRVDGRTLLMLVLLVLTGLSVVGGYRLDAFVWERYLEFGKIILVALLTTGLTDSRRRLHLMTLTIALSLGFFGFKGGLFGVLGGGAAILRGPGGMMEDNNDFALALVMAVPLLWHLGLLETRKWARRGYFFTVALNCVTVVLTHSRGGFLALVATLGVMGLRSRRPGTTIAAAILSVPLFFLLAPTSVIERLATIGSYQEESSAMGRIIAWRAAFRMTVLHPFLGVGMRSFETAWTTRPEIWGEDALPPEGGRVAHNSYFQIMAESGLPAFVCYLAILAGTFLALFRVGRSARDGRAPPWALPYARMFEASLVGFCVGAFFLNRGHFDLAYQIVALATVLPYVSGLPSEEAVKVEAVPGRAGPVSVLGAGPSWPDPPVLPSRFR